MYSKIISNQAGTVYTGYMGAKICMVIKEDEWFGLSETASGNEVIT